MLNFNHFIFIVTTLSLAGCESAPWIHPTATQQQFSKDHFECTINAETARPANKARPHNGTMADLQRETGQNMGSAIVAGIEQSRYYSMCMASKGYTQ